MNEKTKALMDELGVALMREHIAAKRHIEAAKAGRAMRGDAKAVLEAADANREWRNRHSDVEAVLRRVREDPDAMEAACR